MKEIMIIKCEFCEEKHEQEIEVPEGWASFYGSFDLLQSGLCPEHAIVKDFQKAQCDFCDDPYGQSACPLVDFLEFANEQGREEVYIDLRKGVCPKKHTCSLKKGEAYPAAEAGEVFAQALEKLVLAEAL